LDQIRKWKELRLWSCSHCGVGPFVGTTTPSCVKCGHVRCESCKAFDV
jgi:hypothetical protein